MTYIREGDARVVQRKSDRFPFAGDVLVVGGGDFSVSDGAWVPTWVDGASVHCRPFLA